MAKFSQPSHAYMGYRISMRATGELPLLASVIIPAYNAERFLPTTLASAQAQTYASIEIIVIDDGSTDTTAAIAEAAAQRDTRVRLVRQKNAGVAAARNRGLAEAHGDLIAPLDADDVWHPQNIALQVAALKAAGPDAAVSYAWYVSIDEHGRLEGIGPQTHFRSKTRVLPAQIECNFIGNSSSTVIRRDAIEAIGGYDPTLLARGAQGCEDEALYIGLAELWDFVVVPKYLVAYRSHAMGMGKDGVRMARSQALVLADLRRRRPDLPGYWFGRGMARLYASDLTAALRRRDWSEVADVLARAAGDGNWCLLDLLCRRLPFRTVNYCLRKLRPDENAPQASETLVDIFWPTENQEQQVPGEPFQRATQSASPSESEPTR
jgi:glycosyltransferase involved in cell wall biosynthesis